MTCGHGRKRGMTCAKLVALRDKIEAKQKSGQFVANAYGGRLMYNKAPN